MNFLNQAYNYADKIQVDAQQYYALFNILEELRYKFQKNDVQTKWQIFAHRKNCYQAIDKRKNEITKFKRQFFESVNEDIEDF